MTLYSMSSVLLVERQSIRLREWPSERVHEYRNTPGESSWKWFDAGWPAPHDQEPGRKDMPTKKRKVSPGREETWSFWELMGATTGPTRGELAHRIDSMGRNGWELAASLASIGSDGHWPHSMAVFRIADARALEARLDAGFADGMDERNIPWAKTRLARRLRGEFSPQHHACLFEYLRCESRDVLESYTEPDLVFSEAFAPWQGIAIWTATDLHALSKREYLGIGSVGKPGVLQCTGWWAAVPQRALV
jgi:hypothetical protein